MSASNSIAAVLSGVSRFALVQGDCFEVMPLLPDQSIDATLTDPPYSRDLYSRTRTNKGSGLRPDGRPVASGELKPHTSAVRLANEQIGFMDWPATERAAGEMLRLTKRWIIAFHDCENSWGPAFGSAYVRTGAWVKTDPMPQVSGDRPAQGFEPCAIAHRPGRKHWNGGGLPAVWIHGTAKGDGRPDHPCPKPLSLMLDLVGQFTDPGEIVLDPFCGSGTSGVAALRLGRRFVGIERDVTFAELARFRLEAESEHLTVRDALAGQIPLFPRAEVGR